MRKGNFNILFSYFFPLFFSSVWLPLQAQTPVFTASVSGNQVAQNSVFEIQFELQNAKGSNFKAPSFEGFEVVGGPSMGSSTMIVNGVVSQSQSWSFALLARKQGNFTIESASVVAGRKKLNTKPIKIQVTAAKDLVRPGTSPNSREPLLLRADVNGESFYPGQQIILTYRLLFRENVQSVSTLAEDDYSDFFIQNLADFSREATFEIVDGVQFTSRIIRSMALFAHQSGTYTIDPMLMNVGINAPFGGNQGFFNMRKVQEVQVASEPVTIKIIPLPTGAPASFSGAVGQYKIRTLPANTKVSVDEAFTFALEITGNGDSRRWDPPAPVSDGDFEIYDPKIVEDKIMDSGKEMSHIRTVEYQMIPDTTGEYNVHVPLTYFDPGQKKFITISSDTFTLLITTWLNGTKHDSALDTNVQQPSLKKVRTVWLSDRFWVSLPHLLLFSLVLSGAGLGWYITNKRKREKKIPEAERLKSSSHSNAVRQLEILEKAEPPVEAKVFFEQATEIYYRFLSERFTIPPSELDEASLEVYLGKANVDRPSLERAVHFFNQCQVVRYGGIPGGFTREEMLFKIREIIGSLSG